MKRIVQRLAGFLALPSREVKKQARHMWQTPLCLKIIFTVASFVTIF